MCLAPLNADSLPEKFARRDLNKDNQLSREEVPESFSRFKFTQADRNKDGLLDAGELEQVARKLSEKEKKTTSSPADPVLAAEDTFRLMLNVAYRKDPAAKGDSNKLDLYLPSTKGFATIIWIHGGGLHGGDKSKINNVARRFVAEGYGVAAVNYRLYPEAIYPTQIEDVARAFHWVHAHISAKGGDPRRIFVAGGSAGGHLAALLATDQSRLKKYGLTPKDIRGAIAISGLMDVSRVGAQRRKAIWGNDPENYAAASPLHHADKDVPAMLLLHAEHDTDDRRAQNQAMHDALRKASHPDVSIHELKDRTHNNIRPNLAGRDDPGARLILDFLKKQIAAREPLLEKHE